MNDDKMTTIIAADYMYLVFLSDDATIEKIMNKLNNPSNLSNPSNLLKSSEQKTRGQKHTKSTHKKTSQCTNVYVKSEIGNPCISMLDEEQIQKILIDDVKKNITKKNMSVPVNKIKTFEQMTDSEIETYKKYIILDEGIEAAQCLTYADVSSIEISSKNKNNTPVAKTIMLMVMAEYDTHYKLTFPILQLDEEENPDKLIGKWLQENNIEDIIKELTIRPVNIVGNEHEILVFTAHIISST